MRIERQWNIEMENSCRASSGHRAHPHSVRVSVQSGKWCGRHWAYAWGTNAQCQQKTVTEEEEVKEKEEQADRMYHQQAAIVIMYDYGP